MTPLNTQPLQDALLVRYRAAVAELEIDLEAHSARHDEPSGPSAQVRANILAYAQQQATVDPDTDTDTGVTHAAPVADHLNDTKLIAIDSISTSGKELFSYSKTSSNDGQWKIRALASVAIFGLTGLLFMQWDSAPPEQKEIALSAPMPPSAHAADAAKEAQPSTNEAAVQFEASSAAPIAATAPAPVVAPVAAPALRTVPAPPSTTTAPASGETAQNTQIASQSGTEVLPAAQRSKKDNPRSAGERSAQAASVQLDTVAGGLQADQSAVPAQSAKRTTQAPTARMQPQPADAQALSAAPAASIASALAPAPAPAPAPESKSRAARSDKLASADVAAADLFAAIRQKDLAALQRALNQGASKDAKNNGTPAITLCVLSGQIDMVRTLAAQGANVNAVDAQGISPLAHARTSGLNNGLNSGLNSGLDSGHNDIAALLISLGAQ